MHYPFYDYVNPLPKLPKPSANFWHVLDDDFDDAPEVRVQRVPGGWLSVRNTLTNRTLMQVRDFEDRSDR